MNSPAYLLPSQSSIALDFDEKLHFEKLAKSFTPYRGYHQNQDSPSKALQSALLDKDHKLVPQNLAQQILLQFSAHPRESVRDWAVAELHSQVTGPSVFTALSQQETETIFPWNEQYPAFTFCTKRATLLSHAQPMTEQLFPFLIHFKPPVISSKIIRYIHSRTPHSDSGSLTKKHHHAILQIIQHHSPIARKMIAENKDLCWRFFDHLIDRGLPLHTIAAIQTVNWELYQRHTKKQRLDKTLKKIKLVTQHQPALKAILTKWSS